MSKAIYSNFKATSGNPHAEDVEQDVDEEEEYLDEEEEVVQPIGLFGTPARAITLGFSILLLFAVVGMVAWFLGQSGKQSSNAAAAGTDNGEQAFHATSAGSLKPVPDITNSKASYTSKPDGL